MGRTANNDIRPSSMDYLVTHGPGRKTMEKITLRQLTMKDLDEVIRIDTSILGKERRDYWETKLEHAEKTGVPSLAAEIDGNVVGFILGKASEREYGIPENVAWIDTIGVAKEWQKKGISLLLFREMCSMLKKIGIDSIYVLVDKKKRNLINFFDKLGFTNGDVYNMELKI